jgi:Flp pilus assembly protein TadG
VRQMAKLWQKMKDRRGQGLVEFALILPIFLLLLLGIVEFGRIISSQMIVSNASRTGARIAAVQDIEDDALIETLQNHYSVIAIQVADPVYTPSTRTSGGTVKVRVSYDVNIYAPVISTITENPYTVTSETTMYVE